MKWLYWYKSSPDLAAGDWFRTAEEERERHIKHGYNPQLQTWIWSLDADITSGWGYVKNHIAEYDGVLIALINFGDSQKRPLGQMRTELIRKHNPNIIIVGSYDSWVGHPRRILQKKIKYSYSWVKKAVDDCDLVFSTSNAWESFDSGVPMMWNKVWNTTKFTCLLAPFDMEHLATLIKPYEEKLAGKHIISCGPVNYWATSMETAKVLQGFLPEGWRAGLTHTRSRTTPRPFYKMGVLDYPVFERAIADSYMGVFNAVNGGLASIAGMGAALKVPFVGSTTADYIVKCFPDLAKSAKDINGQIQLCKRLINEESFYKEITEKAYDTCKRDYSFEGGKRRLYDELKKRNII